MQVGQFVHVVGSMFRNNPADINSKGKIVEVKKFNDGVVFVTVACEEGTFEGRRVQFDTREIYIYVLCPECELPRCECE